MCQPPIATGTKLFAEAHRYSRHRPSSSSIYAKAGYFTIVEGIIIPGWYFEPLRDSLIERGIEVACAVLRASLSACVSRSRGRARDPLSDASAVEQLWNAFTDLGDLERHIITTDDLPAAAVAEKLARRIARREP